MLITRLFLEMQLRVQVLGQVLQFIFQLEKITKQEYLMIRLVMMLKMKILEMMVLQLKKSLKRSEDRKFFNQRKTEKNWKQLLKTLSSLN